jgi:hypothetical protein
MIAMIFLKVAVFVKCLAFSWWSSPKDNAFSCQDLEEFLRMKLCLTKVVNGCRLGTIQSLGKAGDRSMDIPGCLLYTRTGSAPHLTHHTLHSVHGVPAMAQLTLIRCNKEEDFFCLYVFFVDFQDKIRREILNCYITLSSNWEPQVGPVC